MAVRRRVWIVSALAVLALVVVLVLRTRDRSKPVGPASAAVESESAPSEVETPSIEASERTAVEPGQVVTKPANGTPIRGLVIDLDGSPRGAVALEQRVNTRRTLVAISGDDGTFETRLENFDGILTTGDGAWACVAPCKLDRERANELHVLVVARAIGVIGRVVDARGRGVCQASIGVRVPVEVKQTLPASFSVASDILGAASSDATGHFELTQIALVPGGRLLASAHPLEPAGRPLAASDQPLEIVLADPESERLIEVLVVDSAEQPIGGALIEFGSYHGNTTSDGVFRFTLRHQAWPLDETAALVVCERGYQPASVESFAALALDGARSPLFERVVLVAPDLSIRGRIVDASGRPCRVGSISLAFDKPASNFQSRCIEGRPGFPDEVDGFEIRGLREGDYVLQCALEQPFVKFRSKPIRAGTTDVLLRVPEDALVPRVVGRVVTPDGGVVSRAQLGVRLGTGTRIARFDPDRFFDNLYGTKFCDNAGGFELVDVPRREAQLVVSHTSIATTVLDLGSIDLARELNVVVLRRAKLRIEGLPPTRDEVLIELFDAGGVRPWIRSAKEGVVEGTCLLRTRDGVSETIEVAEGRYTLRARHPVTLAPREIELVAGETLVVRP